MVQPLTKQPDAIALEFKRLSLDTTPFHPNCKAMPSALITMITLFGWLLLLMAGLGALYSMIAALSFRRFFAEEQSLAVRNEPVTILKPLHGDEPCLAENLASFLRQQHDGPIQLLCGVQSADDPAIAVVDTLRARFPDAVIDLVINPAQHGANAKISNLINMMDKAAHPILVLSDSDIAVAPDYLARVLAALDIPKTGAVTCLYRGRGDAGFWSQMGAAGLSYQMLPGAAFGVATQLATPCMGSTIAIRRETLDQIGGFARFADVLADDYAIGEAVRALGLNVAVPPMIVTHGSTERGFAELWRHELRWGATVRSLVPLAYIGSIIAMPFPLALIGAIIAPAHWAGWAVAAVALLARAIVVRAVDTKTGVCTAPLWFLPLRDCLTLAVFIASFFVRVVDWRGSALQMKPLGRISLPK